MRFITCEELFDSVIFDFDDKNPINALCNLINEDESLQLNAELSKIFDEEDEPLAMEYIINRYDRIMSPLFVRLYDKYEEDKEDTCKAVASIIKMKFLFNWNKLAEAVFSDYNPIDNYNMVEQKETDFEEHTTDDTKITNKYSGFNADEMQDVSESATDGDVTKTDTGSKAKNELTRRGNIGVTTTAQMIEGEYNLRKKNILDQIYKDIDTILFIDYYK